MTKATKRIELRLDETLRYFCPGPKKRDIAVVGCRSAKDLIESCGVPHTEVGHVEVNRSPTSLDRLVGAGDHVEATGYRHAIDLSVGQPALNRPPLSPVRFIADVHLGRLVRCLRVLGLDCRYKPPWEDGALAEIGAREHRIMLTRDRGLLKRACIVYGLFVRSDDAIAQAHEVFARFQIREQVRPFSRCPRCNGILQAREKAEVENLIPPGTRRSYEDFHQCRDCDQVYWRGAHCKGLSSLLDQLPPH